MGSKSGGINEQTEFGPIVIEESAMFGSKHHAGEGVKFRALADSS
jgi:hypothetical protein